MSLKASLTSAIALSLVVAGVPASAAETTCTRNSETAVVNIRLDDGTAGIRRDGEDIVFKRRFDGDYRSCDGATIHNTDRIVFTTENTETDVLFEVDMSVGRFAPGRTTEKNGASEIEIVANFAGGGDSLFGLIGTPLSDELVAGSKGVRVNGDDDIDMKINEAGFYRVEGISGDDLLTLNGGDGTGNAVPAPAYNPHILEGGLGNDDLIGGPGPNQITGNADRDKLVGKGGRDFMNGGLGADRLFGLKGSDPGLYGDEGDDHIEGGEGDDLLDGGIGNDHLDGDDGKDACNGGLGMNTHEDCETYKETPVR